MEEKKIKQKIQENASSACGIYFLGFIGYVAYFISHATGFWVGVLGFLKAIIWPVFIVYRVFSYLG